MNTTSEETREDGKQRRKSITPGSGGGQGGGLTGSGGKTRRYSMVVPSSRKSIGEEGNIVPNYLRASTGSCHDFCKYGTKHESSKSAIPVKFKRSSTVVNNKDNKVAKTVVPVERKKTSIKPFTDPKIQTPVELTKKVPILKRVLSTNGKPKESELKLGQRSTSITKPSSGANVSNVGVKTRDIKTVKKTGITPKASSLSRGESLKAIKDTNVKKVSPLKDQNRVQKTEHKETEAKSESIEFDYVQETVGIVDSPLFLSTELIDDPVSRNGLEKESKITLPVYESSKLFQEQEQELLEDSSSMSEVLKKSQSFSEVVEEDSLIAPPVSESSQSFYDDDEEEEEEEETESSDNEKDEKVNNGKIPRKGRMVISDEKDEEGVKLRFRRGKILDVESVNNGPRRLKFRKGKVIEGNEGIQHVSRRNFEKKHEKEVKNDSINNGRHENVVLKHQGEKEKKDAQGLFNNVIEETASKLVESRKSKVKALVGAFETVISLQDGKT